MAAGTTCIPAPPAVIAWTEILFDLTVVNEIVLSVVVGPGVAVRLHHTSNVDFMALTLNWSYRSGRDALNRSKLNFFSVTSVTKVRHVSG